MNDSPPSHGQFERGLRRVLWELREYSSDIVVIGGWVPYLYREYGEFTQWQSNLSRTGEVDVLLGSSAETRGRRPIPVILIEAGFRPVGETSRAAVWVGDAEIGEQVEFLVPHSGTARQIGQMRDIDAQDGLAAISLPDLELLNSFSNTLTLAVKIEGEQPAELEIRVPWLGAYLVNKAASFPKRRPIGVARSAENPKKAKDLLYIRDIAAAGEEVVRRVEDDVAQMRNTGDATQYRVDYAANNLSLVLGGESAALVHEAAAMLAERESIPHHEALADMRGHLSDAREILTGS